jgi:hypothetical protein
LGGFKFRKMKIVLILVLVFISLSHWKASNEQENNKIEQKLHSNISTPVDSLEGKILHYGVTLIEKLP